MVKKIVLGADHGGFLLKERIKEHLRGKGYKVADVGTFSEESCDYPAIGFAAAGEVSNGRAERGIIICKTGIGMAVAANKVCGIRAGVCNSVKDAVSARQHNDTNVLVLAGTKVSGKKAMDIVTAWLETRSLKGRHARRVAQIREFEKKVFK